MPDDVKMIAEAKFRLNAGDQEMLKNGDEFQTDVENGKDLKALGFARFKPQEEGTHDDDPPQDEVTPRRSYRSRNLKVEH